MWYLPNGGNRERCYEDSEDIAGGVMKEYYKNRKCIRMRDLDIEDGAYIVNDGAIFSRFPNAKICDGVYLGRDAQFDMYKENKLIIMEDAWIGPFCYFNSAGGIKIGNKVGIGPRVTILTSEHSAIPAIAAITDTELIFGSVHIQDLADIGAGSIILPGAVVGQGSIVGAGSVVTKNTHIPAYQVWVGNPCKFLRTR